MMKVRGQANVFSHGGDWILSGICTSASKTGTGTYSLTCSKNIEQGMIILVSAERGGTNAERITTTYTDNVITIKNYSSRTSTSLADVAYLMITILESNVPPINVQDNPDEPDDPGLPDPGDNPGAGELG
jgi:hypothetical protein